MNTYYHQLNEIIDLSYDQLQAIDQHDFSIQPSPSKWSKKQIIGHLIDSAYNNHQRFLSAHNQDNLIFQGYDQEAWVALNDYQNRSQEEVLNTWRVANQHLAHLIGGISDDLLNHKTRTHNFHIIGMNRPDEGSLSSLAYLIWDYIFHVEHHLNQILPDYQNRLKAFNE